MDTDINDIDIQIGVEALGLMEGSDLPDPEEFYGPDVWNQMLMADSSGGFSARAQYEYDWNYKYPLAERVRRVWANRMKKAAEPMFDELGEELRIGSADADAEMLKNVLARRSELRGNGGNNGRNL